MTKDQKAYRTVMEKAQGQDTDCADFNSILKLPQHPQAATARGEEEASEKESSSSPKQLNEPDRVSQLREHFKRKAEELFEHVEQQEKRRQRKRQVIKP